MQFSKPKKSSTFRHSHVLVSASMSSSKLNKLSRQPERTWSQLHKRLMEIELDYDQLFPPQIAEYLNKVASSMSTNIGYLVPSILTSTSFISAKKSLINHKQQDMPFNLYMIFVGPPSTGKSQAIKEAAISPMTTIIHDKDIPNFILDKCTSSGLSKSIASNHEGFIISPELYDILNKLLKSDDDNATGDAQLLCELFSGERVTFHYATEKTREIEPNVPFSILGARQVPFAARIIARLDQGHGLLDRFIFTFPTCYRPTLQETDDAQQWLKDNDHCTISDIFLQIEDDSRKVNYKFTEDAQQALDSIAQQEIEEINEALREGNPVPKCKKNDLIKRIAASLHIFNNVATHLFHYGALCSH